MLCTTAFNFFAEELKHLPGNYLEFGVFDGDGLRELALRFPEKKFYGVDPFIEDGNTYFLSGVARSEPMPQQRANAIRNTAGIPNISIFIETSTEFARRFDAPNESGLEALGLSAILIDGSHHFEDAWSDFQFSEKALSRGGVIFFDDTYLPGVSRSVAEFRGKFENRIREATVINSSCSFFRIKPL